MTMGYDWRHWQVLVARSQKELLMTTEQESTQESPMWKPPGISGEVRRGEHDVMRGSSQSRLFFDEIALQLMWNRIISIIPTRLFSTLWLSMQAMVASSPLVKTIPAFLLGKMVACWPALFHAFSKENFVPLSRPERGEGGRGRRKWPAGKKKDFRTPVFGKRKGGDRGRKVESHHLPI